MLDSIIISPLSAGLAGGIIGAIIVFLTTITSILGYSQIGQILAKSSVWKKYGYKVSWGGSIIGAIIGFIYGFVILWLFAIIYNSI
jgi:hypothetical protein